MILCVDIELFSKSVSRRKRESLKFHCVENLTNNTIQILSFTRLVFGLNQSTFISEGTLKTHFERYESMYLKLIRKIRDDMCVDDLVLGGESLQEVQKIKNNDLNSEKELNFAKELLGTKANETKILGLN